jgi:TRAP-type C4-dicarboxylate transport system permease small subunit
MQRLEKVINAAGSRINIIAGGAVVIMMTLTCADVIMRLFGRPLPGTYDIVGFLGTIAVSFSLAYTSIERGHIAVELLTTRLPQRMQIAIEGFNSLICSILFALITWQSVVYGRDIMISGEVSPTIQMPMHPIVFGMAAGFGILSLVLLMDFLSSFRRLAK